ncbi:Copine I [Spironucleus salmonicida]|uniref:Copine I n=1 Tax=Spironucleus salmonicida TaxID=348837 RepID=V6LMP5_9EUKA|nr:Copine I [Spironucleus salmonicida]|eukprot:EST44986.1 Copine I [Spironucleus salmonicida]
MGSSESKRGNPIPDKYKTFQELEQALRNAGIESLQCAFFFDFSKSNTWTGQNTYQGRSLHDTTFSNPYIHAMDVMAPLIPRFDDDGIIPAFRFGCMDTKDKIVTPLLFPQVQDPHFSGIDALKQAYIQICQSVVMSGPTTFAPSVEQAIQISAAYKHQQQLFVILITDGDVSDLERDKQAFIQASNYPISFCALGFGDGPFTKMQFFDDMKGRKFDNFQFVNFTKIECESRRTENPELILATKLMQELPAQFEQMKQIGII